MALAHRPSTGRGIHVLRDETRVLCYASDRSDLDGWILKRGEKVRRAPLSKKARGARNPRLVGNTRF